MCLLKKELVLIRLLINYPCCFRDDFMIWGFSIDCDLLCVCLGWPFTVAGYVLAVG